MSTEQIGKIIYNFIDPTLFVYDKTNVVKLGNGKRVQVQCSLIGKNITMAIGSVIMLSDVTEKELLFEEMERVANTDVLTGCYNRYALHNQLKQQIIESRLNSKPLSLLTLDVQKFRKLNELHGYTIGDMRLKQLSHILGYHLPINALLSRYIGDIFVVILPSYHLESASQVAEQLVDKVKQLTTLSINTYCIQHLSEESDRQLIDRLLNEAMLVKKFRSDMEV